MLYCITRTCAVVQVQFTSHMMCAVQIENLKPQPRYNKTTVRPMCDVRLRNISAKCSGSPKYCEIHQIAVSSVQRTWCVQSQVTTSSCSALLIQVWSDHVDRFALGLRCHWDHSDCNSLLLRSSQVADSTRLFWACTKQSSRLCALGRSYRSSPDLDSFHCTPN